MIPSLIIEDEKRSARILHKLIDEVSPEVNVLSLEHSIAAGLKAIEALQPQLIFLDVKLPFGTGFDLLDQVEEINFEVIFTTAFESYAIQAIKWSALDYLLKPIDKHELRNAIDKVHEKQAKSGQQQKIDLLLQNLLDSIGNEHKTKSPKIAVPTLNGFEFINANDILYCEAEGTYCKICCKNSPPILVSRNLKNMESLLGEHPFFRVHRSFIVNMNHVTKYIKGNGGELYLSTGKAIPVAQRRKEVFVNYLFR